MTALAAWAMIVGVVLQEVLIGGWLTYRWIQRWRR